MNSTPIISDDLIGTSPCDDDPMPGINSFCRASFPAIYYDKLKNECIEFIYGGCHATTNLFGSFEDCEIVCMGKSGDSNEWQPIKMYNKTINKRSI